jgi:DNA-damage-inducible protein J
MAQTNINIRMDKDLKTQFESFCSEVGLTMSVAFNIFAKTVVKQKRIPFEISTEKELKREGWIIPKGEENDPFWSETNLKALNESIRGAEAGKLTEHELIEA